MININIKFKKSYLLYISLLFGLCIIFIVNYKGTLEKIEDEATLQEANINHFISRAHDVSDSLIVYAESFLENDVSNESEYMKYFVYEEEIGMYTLMYPDGIPSNGVNVTGLETLPTDEEELQELYMAISLGNMFRLYYESLSEVSWLFYTSESGYTSLYPWVPSDDFVNTETVKEKDYYAMATPENNPTGEKVWCPLYVDGAGQGNIFTLSQPLYSNGQFMGVISVEFTDEALNDRFTTDYDCYIVNEYDQIIGTNNPETLPEGIVTINECFGVSYEEIVSEVEEGTGFITSNGQYVTTLNLVGSDYFYGFIAVPMSQIILESVLKTLPFLLLVIILIVVFIALENRKKRFVELEKLKNQLAKQAITDPLTTIYNRRKFEETIYEKLEKEDDTNFYLAVLDLDYFKNINDKFGHDAGDRVLVGFADLLIKHLFEYERAGVRYSRIGGEEFAIIFPDFDEEVVKAICESLRAKIEMHDFEVGTDVTISIGVAKIPSGSCFNAALKKADDKLYEAKHTGRNKIMYDI